MIDNSYLNLIFDKSQLSFMAIEIHNIDCPKCKRDTLCYDRYEATWKILKPCSWLYCKHCDYEIDMEKFKKSLACA